MCHGLVVFGGVLLHTCISGTSFFSPVKYMLYINHVARMYLLNKPFISTCRLMLYVAVLVNNDVPEGINEDT